LSRSKKSAKQAQGNPAGDITWSAPTPERRAKAVEGFAVTPQPGGLRTYKALTPYQANESHFTDQEQAAALRFIRDMELAGQVRIVPSGTYEGMPSTGTGSGSYLRSQAQMAAAERADWLLENIDERFLAFLDVILMGVKYRLEHRPMSLAELGAQLSRFKGADQSRACAVGFAKGCFVRIDEAYRAWGVEYLRRRKAAEQRRAIEDATAKAEGAKAPAKTEWAAERERELAKNRSAILQAYDEHVLKKWCAPRPRRQARNYEFEVTLDRRVA
jgi:hypothetical protein